MFNHLILTVAVHVYSSFDLYAEQTGMSLRKAVAARSNSVSAVAGRARTAGAALRGAQRGDPSLQFKTVDELQALLDKARAAGNWLQVSQLGAVLLEKSHSTPSVAPLANSAIGALRR